MTKSKLPEINEKIAEKVTAGYKKIENTVVGSYKKVEDAITGTYQKIEDSFVERYLTKDGESWEEAKKRIRGNR